MGRRLDRAIRLVLAAPLLVALVIHGSTKRGQVIFPQTEAGRGYINDAGSFVTNDYVHVDFVTRIVPSSANLLVDYREVASTNAEDFASLVSTTFAEFTVPQDIPFGNATNFNFYIYTDWTPGPSVQTNGVLHANWGKSLNDADGRNHGLIIGIPVQTTVWLGAEMVGTPGGTNSPTSSSAELIDRQKQKGKSE